MAVATAIAAPILAQTAPADPFLTANAKKPGVHVTSSGLQYRVLKPGSGAFPGATDVALILYRGKLANGTTFDSVAQPVPLPVDKVVPGFAEGLRLMRKGATVRLWIPPALGYGAKEQRDDQGKVVIPANAILVFDVTLVDFMPLEGYERLRRLGEPWVPSS